MANGRVTFVETSRTKNPALVTMLVSQELQFEVIEDHDHSESGTFLISVKLVVLTDTESEDDGTAKTDLLISGMFLISITSNCSSFFG